MILKENIMKNKIVSYFVPVSYPDRKIEIIIGKDQARLYTERFLKDYPDMLLDFIEGHPLNGLTCSSGCQYLLCLPKLFDHCTVYHEVFHVCMRIWYDAGANLSFPENDEVITYMIGTIVKQIEEIYKWESNQNSQSN